MTDLDFLLAWIAATQAGQPLALTVALVCAFAMLAATGLIIGGMGMAAYRGGRGIWRLTRRIGR